MGEIWCGSDDSAFVRVMSGDAEEDRLRGAARSAPSCRFEFPALYAAAVLRPWVVKAAHMIRVAMATEAGHLRSARRRGFMRSGRRQVIV